MIYLLMFLLGFSLMLLLYIGNGIFYEMEVGKENGFSLFTLMIYNVRTDGEYFFITYFDVCIFGYYLSIINKHN